MSTFSIIQQKLEVFIKKYYTNELIKGIILFLTMGLLYLLVTLLVEYFLWLNSFGRMVLFYAFVIVELLLFIRFIAYPLALLFKLRKGIDYEDASRIIGSHFPQVSDKLLNVIQLNQNRRESELLAASIDQKAHELQPIPFQSAINFKKNVKYLKYFAIPILLFLIISVLGDVNIFSSSYTRVVNYDTAYEPPAPFVFIIARDNLSAIEGKPFTLQVRTEGNTLPENASIEYSGQTFYMQKVRSGLFEYTFQQMTEPVKFNLRGNTVRSRPYILDVVNTPSLVNFEMVLTYPSYIKKASEILKGTGNAIVPEGTRVKWQASTKNTTRMALKTEDTIFNFVPKNSEFYLEKTLFNKFEYTITTSNKDLEDYENLSFAINTIKDQYPEIHVQSKTDSLDSQKLLFLGRVSDDYGLTKLQVVYYPEGEEEQKKSVSLPVNSSTFDQFTFVFPGNLELEAGKGYEYYFEIFDNDAIHRYKSSKSGIYSFRKLTHDELEREQLENQQKSILGLDRSLEELKLGKTALEEISRTQKEKNELNFNDKKKLENFIQRQQRQDEMMKEFSQKLKDDLKNFQPENKNDEFKEQLQERLQENEERLKEDEKLLEELKKLQDKIQKEEFTDRLEKLAKQNKNKEKNLEQLLELTKRYYVEKKAEKLADELFKLGEDQEKLSNEPKEKNTEQEQEKLNQAFEEYKKQMEDLQKENQDLKKPLDIPQEKQTEEEIDEEQEKATDKLKKSDPSGAGENQKKAAQKMKKMGMQMKQQMSAGQMETLDEDVKMLRQILQNLVVFSFKQEELMNVFKEIKYGNPVFGKMLTVQNELKNNFEHIDDSLFALGLRQPLLGDKINSSLTEIQYNIDKSLDRLAQNNISQGIVNQQYTMSGANDLAVLLDELLSNMQMQLQMSMGSGSGKGAPSPGEGGSGEGFQLPDIIKKQESLNEKMEEGMEKGGNKGEGEGEGEGDGKEGTEGKDGGGKEGDGKDGKGGTNGPKEGVSQNGFSEDINGELFEIYKQQQQLRMQLQDKLSKGGLDGNATNLLRRMEHVEQQLLEKGFNQSTLRQMQNLKHELLKLDKAALEQGEENRRESRTNYKTFRPDGGLTPEEIKKYFNTNEILNREALPLHQDYKEKVKEYFRENND